MIDILKLVRYKIISQESNYFETDKNLTWETPLKFFEKLQGKISFGVRFFLLKIRNLKNMSLKLCFSCRISKNTMAT